MEVALRNLGVGARSPAGGLGRAALSLSQAIDETIAASPTIAKTQASIAAADARIDQAWSLILPSLTTRFTYTHWDKEVALDFPNPVTGQLERTVLQKQEQLDSQTTLSITLFDYSAWPLLDNAYDAVKIQELSAEEAERALAVQATLTYIQILVAQRGVALAETDLAFYEEHLRAAEKRLEGGIGDKLDIIRTKQQIVDARHRTDDAERTVAFAKESLALLMNRDDSSFAVSDTLDLPETGTTQTALVEYALGSRNDLAISERAQILADRDIDVTWAKFLPDRSGLRHPHLDQRRWLRGRLLPLVHRADRRVVDLRRRPPLRRARLQTGRAPENESRIRRATPRHRAAGSRRVASDQGRRSPRGPGTRKRRAGNGSIGCCDQALRRAAWRTTWPSSTRSRPSNAPTSRF